MHITVHTTVHINILEMSYMFLHLLDEDNKITVYLRWLSSRSELPDLLRCESSSDPEESERRKMNRRQQRLSQD